MSDILNGPMVKYDSGNWLQQTNNGCDSILVNSIVIDFN
jgi:hypothetical protein